MAPKSYGKYMNDEILSRMKKLGLSPNLKGTEDGTHNCAVKDNNYVIEKLTKDNIIFSGSIRNGAVIYKLNVNTDAINERGHAYSMVIDGKQCGNQYDGINIVVYDNDLKCIIDKININTNSEELKMQTY